MFSISAVSVVSYSASARVKTLGHLVAFFQKIVEWIYNSLCQTILTSPLVYF